MFHARGRIYFNVISRFSSTYADQVTLGNPGVTLASGGERLKNLPICETKVCEKHEGEMHISLAENP
jgi:hypothetical protein